VRVSLAGLMFCDANLNAPKERAEANEVDEKAPAAVVAPVGDCGVPALDWRRSCKALASAFSCVRTKLARF